MSPNWLVDIPEDHKEENRAWGIMVKLNSNPNRFVYVDYINHSFRCIILSTNIKPKHSNNQLAACCKF